MYSHIDTNLGTNLLYARGFFQQMIHTNVLSHKVPPLNKDKEIGERRENSPLALLLFFLLVQYKNVT